MKLAEIHLLKYARVDGSTKSMFTAAEGWSIELRPDLGGVIVGRKNRDDLTKLDQILIPFTNVLNATPAELVKPIGAK